jgi:hypothetical protein
MNEDDTRGAYHEADRQHVSDGQSAASTTSGAKYGLEHCDESAASS